MMYIETHDYTLGTAHCDVNRRLRLSELFTWFQEAAIHQTSEMGMGREMTLDKGLLWIVTQWRVEITRLPEYDEHVTLETWPGRTMHIFFTRFYRIKDDAGNILVQASALWALMDKESRKIVFPEEMGVHIEGTEVEGQCAIPRPPRAIPQTSESRYTVTYSVLDLNGHMNNTRYFDLMQDALYDLKKGAPPKLILCEYNGEARLGDDILVKFGEADSEVYLTGEAEKRLFRMRLTY
ncbi:MAG: hypothetical protein IJP43_08415 [Oscillospiraceae bacterium]|nr:hypothetical protein [Oscillospiraceae bacterium]